MDFHPQLGAGCLAIAVDEIVVSYIQWREVLIKGWSISALGKSDTQLLNSFFQLQSRSWKCTEGMGYTHRARQTLRFSGYSFLFLRYTEDP